MAAIAAGESLLQLGTKDGHKCGGGDEHSPFVHVVGTHVLPPSLELVQTMTAVQLGLEHVLVVVALLFCVDWKTMQFPLVSQIPALIASWRALGFPIWLTVSVMLNVSSGFDRWTEQQRGSTCWSCDPVPVAVWL
jgi:hypothetical protein